MTQPTPVIAASDLHGILPEVGPCELLLLAGDLLPPEIEDDVEASRAWLAGLFAEWLDDVPAREVVACAGNHDFVLAELVGQGAHPGLFGARWTYLQDALLVTGCGLRVWGTPWTPQVGGWAFEADRERISEAFDGIPAGLDVLVAHCPPFGHGDRARRPSFTGPLAAPIHEYDHIGSPELLTAIERAAPQLCVFGHVHSDGGYRHQFGQTLLANVSVINDRYDRARPADAFQITAGKHGVGADGAQASADGTGR